MCVEILAEIEPRTYRNRPEVRCLKAASSDGFIWPSDFGGLDQGAPDEPRSDKLPPFGRTCVREQILDAGPRQSQMLGSA
jgi:hypothetical protein